MKIIRLVSLLALLVLPCLGQTPAWLDVCRTDAPHSNTCPVDATHPPARGFNWSFPYDTVNNWFLVNETGPENPTGIYSTDLWRYRTSDHTFAQLTFQTKETMATNGITRSGNVVTVTMSSPLVWVKSGATPLCSNVNPCQVIVSGTTGCSTSANGTFTVASASTSSFTYSQVGPNETCGGSSGYTTMLTDNGSECSYPPTYGSTQGQNLLLKGGHPLGQPAFDSSRGQWIADAPLCQQYSPGYTSRWDATTKTLLSPIASFAYQGSCASGSYGCGSWGWGNGTTCVGGYCYSGLNRGSGFYLARWDGSLWSDISSGGIGSDAVACTSGSAQCPPNNLNGSKFFNDGTDLWVFGGCIGSSPGNGTGSNGCTTNGGTENYDLFKGVISGTTTTWTKISPVGGVKPTGTNPVFPFLAHDSQRGRFVYYAATNTLWQYVKSTNTWSTLSATGNGPLFDANLQNGSDANSAGYDPTTDTMVLIYARGQDIAPGVSELSFGNPPPAGNTFNVTVSELTSPAVNDVMDFVSVSTPKAINGTNRSNDLVETGVPLPDSWNVAGSSPQLGFTGVGAPSAGQFECLKQWASGNCQWALVSTLATFNTGSTQTITATTGGTGNFGGSNLATNNNDCSGSNSNYICVDTGAAKFAIKKQNHNIVDSVVVGATTVVTSGGSGGFKVVGPAADGTTVSCPTPPTTCTTVYTSGADSTSSAVILRNGPVTATIYATGGLVNGSETYLTYGAYYTFTKGKTGMEGKIEVRNAVETFPGDTNQAFKGAWKQHKDMYLSIPLTLTGSKTSTFSSDTTNQSYTFSASEDAYKFQGYSTRMQSDAPPVPPIHVTTGTYDLDGLRIYQSGSSTPLYSVNHNGYDDGFWGDVVDGSGRGVLASVYEGSAFWPKAIGYYGGGTELRISLWPDQAKWLQNPSAAIPYTVPYPSYLLDKVYIEFHASTLASPAASATKFQVPLMLRADRTHNNNSGAIPNTLTDPTELNNYFTAVSTEFSPTVSWAATPYDAASGVFHHWGWNAPGGANMTDWRWDAITQWLRGNNWPGRLRWAADFWKHVQERVLPRSDGTYYWTDHFSNGKGGLNTLGYPNFSMANDTADYQDYCDGLHCFIYSAPNWYYLTGDLQMKAYVEGDFYDHWRPTYCNNTSWPGLIPWGAGTCGDGDVQFTMRGMGGSLLAATRLQEYFASPGPTNSSSKATEMVTAQNYLTEFLKHDFKVSGTGDNSLHIYRGISYTRGVPYPHTLASNIFTGANWAACNGTTSVVPPSLRVEQPYQVSVFLQGLKEALNYRGTAWSDYYLLRDMELGIVQWAMNEATRNNGSGVWDAGDAFHYYNGSAYTTTLDYTPNQAGSMFSPPLCENTIFYAPSQTVWWIWQRYHQLTGDASFKVTMDYNVRRLMGNGPGASPNLGISDSSSYMLAEAVHSFNNPPTKVLKTVPIVVTPNGGSSYTVTWTPPSGVVDYNLKFAQGKTMVEWLGYNPWNGTDTPGCDSVDYATNCINGTWQFSPSSYAPYFSATRTGTQPNAAANSITVTTDALGNALPAGMTTSNFMLKANADATPGSSTGTSVKPNFKVSTGVVFK